MSHKLSVRVSSAGRIKGLAKIQQSEQKLLVAFPNTKQVKWMNFV